MDLGNQPYTTPHLIFSEFRRFSMLFDQLLPETKDCDHEGALRRINFTRWIDRHGPEASEIHDA